ncbi:hypothetical protein O3P69_009455 [Scylla paramamosain]|uniref:Uncharacterized protein n=1 Tax=Scylla paramamosain TaxID=85552 RepID=A0AAW0SVA2_SCYPA
MNSAPKADLISILMFGICVPTEIPVTDIKTCVLIDEHIQTPGKPLGCQTSGTSWEPVKCLPRQTENGRRGASAGSVGRPGDQVDWKRNTRSSRKQDTRLPWCRTFHAQ